MCAYLACKVEEFNVSITQFVGNQKAVEQDTMINMILTMELLLMQQLHYHLTVHNPFRPLEGLLIDIKVWGGDNNFSFMKHIQETLIIINVLELHFLV